MAMAMQIVVSFTAKHKKTKANFVRDLILVSWLILTPTFSALGCTCSDLFKLRFCFFFLSVPEQNPNMILNPNKTPYVRTHYDGILSTPSY